MFRALGADLGFVPIVIGGCSLLYVLSLLATGTGIFQGGGLFSFLSPSVPALFLFGASGAVPVFRFGRWWTVLSASWLHGGLLHIVFNMLWVRQLGPACADLVGPARTVIIYTVAGVTGFTLSSLGGAYLGFLPLPMLRGAGFTVGASASIFGLLGALVHYGNRVSSSVKQQALGYALPLFLFGFIMPGVDNYAHAGGFLGGYAASAFLNPLTRERGDHLLVAVGCLVATLLAVLFSVLSGLSIFSA
jgi:rhomboid protease GluP